MQKRMKVQLRFWRSRNWLESALGSSASRVGSRRSSRTGFPIPPSIMMDSSSDDDFSLYFNPIRPPSILSEGALSLESSPLEEYYSPAQATRRPSLIPSGIRGQDLEGTRTNRSMPFMAQTTKTKALQQNLPSIPATGSSPNRTNAEIILDTLQDMHPPRLEADDYPVPTRSRNPEAVQSSPYSSEPTNSKLNFKSSPQGLQPRPSNGRGNAHQPGTAMQPVLLEPLNAALLSNTSQQGGGQSPQQAASPALSSRLPSKHLQPIPAEVLNASFRANEPTQAPKQQSSRSIPSLNFGSVERFPPSKALSANSKVPKVSKSLHPLQSEPSTSRVNAQTSSPAAAGQLNDHTSLSSNLPAAQPIEHDAQPAPSPRHIARNAPRNLSPRSPRAPLAASSQLLHDGQALPTTSGSPPRSPRRIASPLRRSHPSANPQEPATVENGLMIVGRSSTTQ